MCLFPCRGSRTHTYTCSKTMWNLHQIENNGSFPNSHSPSFVYYYCLKTKIIQSAVYRRRCQIFLQFFFLLYQTTPRKPFVFHTLIHIELAVELAHQNQFINETSCNSIQIIEIINLFDHKNDTRLNFSHSKRCGDASLSLSQSICLLSI